MRLPIAAIVFPLIAYLSNWPAVRAQDDVTVEYSSTTLMVSTDQVTLETTTFFASEQSDPATLPTSNGSEPEATPDQASSGGTDAVQAESTTTSVVTDTTTVPSTSLEESLPEVNPAADPQPVEQPTNTATTTSSLLPNETATAQQETSTASTTTETPAPETTTTTQAPTTTTTQPSTVETTPQTTAEKRPTLPTTSATTLTHQCGTSIPCNDPNSHCVSVAGRNTCQCRIGYRRNTARGVCIEVTTEPPPTTTTTTTAPTTNQPADVGTTGSSNHAGSDSKKIPLVKVEDLGPNDGLEVVTFSLEPAVSVIEWLFEKDLLFRSTIATILSNTDLQTSTDEEPQRISVSADQVLYLAPSPIVSGDRLIVSILVENSNQVQVKPYSIRGVVANRRRRGIDAPANYMAPKYFPATWIVQAVSQGQEILENKLNQTMPTLYGGEVPGQLYQSGLYATVTLLERRLDIFIPLLLTITLSCMVIVSLVCVRAKKRSTATWDPPAGIIFGRVRKPQASVKEEREDPLGSVNRLHSSGHNLATDEQCREGEDHHPIKPGRMNSEDDVWVVPFEDAPSGNSVIRTQFEDTKL